MTFLKSMWKSVVLMGIAGVLMFAGGAFAAIEGMHADSIAGPLSPVAGSKLEDFKRIDSVGQYLVTGTDDSVKVTWRGWRVKGASSYVTGGDGRFAGGTQYVAEFGLSVDSTTVGFPVDLDSITPGKTWNVNVFGVDSIKKLVPRTYWGDDKSLKWGGNFDSVLIGRLAGAANNKTREFFVYYKATKTYVPITAANKLDSIAPPFFLGDSAAVTKIKTRIGYDAVVRWRGSGANAAATEDSVERGDPGKFAAGKKYSARVVLTAKSVGGIDYVFDSTSSTTGIKSKGTSADWLPTGATSVELVKVVDDSVVFYVNYPATGSPSLVSAEAKAISETATSTELKIKTAGFPASGATVTTDVTEVRDRTGQIVPSPTLSATLTNVTSNEGTGSLNGLNGLTADLSPYTVKIAVRTTAPNCTTATYALGLVVAKVSTGVGIIAGTSSATVTITGLNPSGASNVTVTSPTTGITASAPPVSGNTRTFTLTGTAISGATAGSVSLSFTLKGKALGVADTSSLDVTHSLTVTAGTSAAIAITADPATTTNLVALSYGSGVRVNSADTLAVVATAPGPVVLGYQWYTTTSTTTPTTTDGSAVSGATSAKFAIPKDLAAGTYYYYVKVSGTGATVEAKRSAVATVTVSKRALSPTLLSWNSNTNREYNGSAQGIAAVTVAAPTSGETYTYTYKYWNADDVLVGNGGSDPAQITNQGVYTVEVTATGAKWDDCVSSKTRTLTISRKSVANNAVTIEVKDYYKVYDGTAKEPAFVVKDAASGKTLTEGEDFEGTETSGYAYKNNKDAGLATAALATAPHISIKGINNYQGTATKTFEITKAAIAIDTSNSTVAAKAYDGTTTLPVANVSLAFLNLIGSPTVAATDYVLTPANTKFANANVPTAAAGVRAEITNIKLSETSALMKNYQLSGTTLYKSKTASGGDLIVARQASDTDFNFDTTKLNQYYTGNAVGIGNVTFRTGYAAQPSGSSLTVLYTHPTLGDTTVVPKEEGSYAVKVRVNKNTNFNGDTVVTLGTYNILKPLPPTIVKALPFDTTVRKGKSVTLTIEATSPNAPASNTNPLRYQWYKNDVAVAGATTKSITYTPAAGDTVGLTVKYNVMVWNNPGTAVQVQDSVLSSATTVTVKAAAKSIGTATIEIGGEYVYNATAQTPQSITVKVGGVDLFEGTHYEIDAITRNINAGTAQVKINGIDDYEGSKTGTFAIAKKELEETDVEFITSVEYNGAPQAVKPTLADANATGLGVATIRYITATGTTTTAPTDAGVYKITASFAEGTNYTASDGAFELGDYEIAQKEAVKADLKYTEWDPEVLLADAKGIGAVTFKDTTFTGYGKLYVIYDGDSTVPTELGSYDVFAVITGGKNFYPVDIYLGTYNIVDEVSVAQSGREVPNKVVVGEASVAPIKAFASSFTAGPSPVSKSAGKIAFFSTKSVKGGSLYVFDANGNAVAKVAAKQGVGKEVGVWNLKNNKGAAVAEGTYVVKGSLLGKDGTKEKVSFVFSVK